MMNYKNLQTPCFILSEQDLASNIQGFQRALQNNFENVIVGYSVKTNSLPYCLAVAKQYGCYAEVVSYNEYALALKLGFPQSHIIYNGPLKSKETFLKAIVSGAIVNIETWREIEWLQALPTDKVYQVGLRLNIDISDISPADENHEKDDSRFGFAAKTDEFGIAVAQISKLHHICLAGIHTHRTSRTRSLDFYRHTIDYALQVIEKYGLCLKYWDLGGGFFGPMPGKPTFNDYSAAMADKLLPKLKDLTIIVEPGNALVASCFDYVFEVIDVKHHNEQYYVTTNGTRNDVDPFFQKRDYFKTIIHQKPEVKVPEQQIICGSTCLEYDRMFNIDGGGTLLKVGDQIIFNRVGAYTMALTPLFIHYFPCVYLKKTDGSLELVRDEWTEYEFIQNSKY